MMEYLDEYLYNIDTMDEFSQILEIDLNNIVKKVMPKTKLTNLVNDIEDSAKKKDVKSIQNKIKKVGIPVKVKQSTLDRMGSLITPDYEKNKELAKRILKNSMKISKRMIDPTSSALAIASSFKHGRSDNRDEVKRLKNLTMKVVENARSFYDEYEEKADEKKKSMPTEAAMDVAVGIAVIMGVASAMGLATVFFLAILPKIVYLLLVIGFLAAFIVAIVGSSQGAGL